MSPRAVQTPQAKSPISVQSTPGTSSPSVVGSLRTRCRELMNGREVLCSTTGQSPRAVTPVAARTPRTPDR
eukprot:2824770-Prymnesium_polylepis.1